MIAGLVILSVLIYFLITRIVWRVNIPVWADLLLGVAVAVAAAAIGGRLSGQSLADLFAQDPGPNTVLVGLLVLAALWYLLTSPLAQVPSPWQWGWAATVLLLLFIMVAADYLQNVMGWLVLLAAVLVQALLIWRNLKNQ